MKPFPRAVLAAVLLALIGVSGAHAGDAARDQARLRARVSPALATRLTATVERARADGLPTDPLVARALEGASREASDAEILDAVERQAAALGEARRALGDSARPVELVAGASALMAGVPRDSLVRLRASRGGGSLVVALVVMSDLVARGVPVETASASVIAATRAGAGDEALLRMRERVHERIQRGELPGGATRDGLRELLQRDAKGTAGTSRR
ncbi:MAG: hypothetical protein ACHQ52_08905 [Candidatus Eisenbacteria bacterium]